MQCSPRKLKMAWTAEDENDMRRHPPAYTNEEIAVSVAENRRKMKATMELLIPIRDKLRSIHPKARSIFWLVDDDHFALVE